MIRPILQWPDPRLRTPADPVAVITDEIRSIWQDMVDTMDAMPGVGLGAPQIGVMLRLAVVDVTPDRSRRILMANPERVEASHELRTHEEASPCLPGVSARLKRPKRVTVQFLNSDGAVMRRDFEDLESTSVQHQIDHINGRMYFDNLSKMKRDMLLRKAKKVAP
ncbi:MAG: peptide deformylase [Paracoccaceae bacterium]